MLLYIIHLDKIYDFHLSNDISGKYILTDFDQLGVKRNLVNIEAINNKWYMFENNNVKIKKNGQKHESIALEPYNFY